MKRGSEKSSGKGHKVSFKLPEEDVIPNMTELEPGDPLPIVELKPFVSKVWRREKSFVHPSDKGSIIPDKLDKSDTVSDVANGSTKSVDGGSDEANETKILPPPRTAQPTASVGKVKRLLSHYVEAYDDFNAQKEHFRSFASEYELRRKPRERLHPLADSKSKKQTEHSASIIPGFITRDDRTKTTLDEIFDGEIPTRTLSSVPKFHRPEDLQRQQEIRISGQPFQHDIRPYESTPTPIRGYNSIYPTFGIRHGSPASMLTTARVMKERRMKRAKTPLYDSLDRTGTLPSLIINTTCLLKRDSMEDDMESEDYTDLRDMYPPQSIHKVGGIENSLALMSREGPPTKVERQLTFELESNLSRFRKSKDYSPFEINPSEIAKYCPTPVLKMTRGEEHIRQALQLNSSKRNVKGKKDKAKVSVSRPLGTQNHSVQAALRKSYMATDHIDSFNAAFNDEFYEQVSADLQCPRQGDPDDSDNLEDELMVPYDTPRSRMDSRFSLRYPEDSRRVQSEPVNETMYKDSSKPIKQDFQYSNKTDKRTNANKSTNRVNFLPSNSANTPRKSKEIKHQNGYKDTLGINKSTVPKTKDIRETRANLPPGKALEPMGATVAVDTRGRTFLTSDNVLQVTSVNG